MNLIIKADPIQTTEIFEVTDTGMILVYSCKSSQEIFQYLKDTVKDNTEVVFIGPKVYTKHFIDQANQFEFVKAVQG